MAGIRGPHPTRPLRAVEGERVRGQVLAPEFAFKLFPQCPRLLLQDRRTIGVIKCRSDSRGPTLGGVNVALHFAQRDGSLGELSVSVKDGVVRVLPALVGQSLGRSAVILDKAVAVAIAVNVDPT